MKYICELFLCNNEPTFNRDLNAARMAVSINNEAMGELLEEYHADPKSGVMLNTFS